MKTFPFAATLDYTFVFFFFTLVTGPRRSLILKPSDTRVSNTSPPRYHSTFLAGGRPLAVPEARLSSELGAVELADALLQPLLLPGHVDNQSIVPAQVSSLNKKTSHPRLEARFVPKKRCLAIQGCLRR